MPTITKPAKSMLPPLHKRMPNATKTGVIAKPKATRQSGGRLGAALDLNCIVINTLLLSSFNQLNAITLKANRPSQIFNPPAPIPLAPTAAFRYAPGGAW